jgi:dTDP-4-dehydrorhamnose 3,5-epimerase
MINLEVTPIDGVMILHSNPFRDSRGEFTRIFCDQDLNWVLQGKNVRQINRSITYNTGVVRGMHYQYAPHAETKIVRCTAGKVFDVAVDLRIDSPTFLRWFGIELDSEKSDALLLPEGCAHGFQTLLPNCQMLYLHTSRFAKNAEGGVRFDDPKIGIKWPITVTEVSQRDSDFPYLDKNFRGISA